MKVVIIEDELPQALHLKGLLEGSEIPLKVCGVIQSVSEAVAFLRVQNVDLIFLDIHLADGLCFDIFGQVTLTVPVIFTTAYDKYAIDAFRHNGIDYLLKPITTDALKKSLQKFMSFTGQATDYVRMMESIRNITAGMRNYRKRFITRLGRKLRIVTTEDIAYFYTLGGGVFIRTGKNENLLVDNKMETLEQDLDPYEFFRLNRKVIARASAIKEMLPYSKSRIKVILNPPYDEDVIVSYQHVRDFMQWVKK